MFINSANISPPLINTQQISYMYLISNKDKNIVLFTV